MVGEGDLTAAVILEKNFKSLLTSSIVLGFLRWF